MSELTIELNDKTTYYNNIKIPALVRYEMYEESPVKGKSVVKR